MASIGCVACGPSESSEWTLAARRRAEGDTYSSRVWLVDAEGKEHRTGDFPRAPTGAQRPFHRFLGWSPDGDGFYVHDGGPTWFVSGDRFEELPCDAYWLLGSSASDLSRFRGDFDADGRRGWDGPMLTKLWRACRSVAERTLVRAREVTRPRRHTGTLADLTRTRRLAATTGHEDERAMEAPARIAIDRVLGTEPPQQAP